MSPYACRNLDWTIASCGCVSARGLESRAEGVCRAKHRALEDAWLPEPATCPSSSPDPVPPRGSGLVGTAPSGAGEWRRLAPGTPVAPGRWRWPAGEAASAHSNGSAVSRGTRADSRRRPPSEPGASSFTPAGCLPPRAPALALLPLKVTLLKAGEPGCGRRETSLPGEWVAGMGRRNGVRGDLAEGTGLQAWQDGVL